jgi:hypothetical protein
MLATGDLPVDHTVAVEAYQNNHLLPFSSHFVRIEALREATGLVVSRDSVVLTVR